MILLCRLRPGAAGWMVDCPSPGGGHTFRCIAEGRFPLRSGGRPPAAILSARTESMEKDAPKGGPFGIPTNLNCVLLWFFSSGQCFPETVKNPTGFFGPLIVRCTSCPISRRLPKGRSQAPQIGTRERLHQGEAAGSRANRTARAKAFFGALHRTLHKQGRGDSKGFPLW